MTEPNLTSQNNVNSSIPDTGATDIPPRPTDQGEEPIAIHTETTQSQIPKGENLSPQTDTTTGTTTNTSNNNQSPPFIITSGLSRSSTKPLKKNRKKLVATILGLLLLIGGVTTGIILTRQPQEIAKKAFIPPADVQKTVDCDKFTVYITEKEAPACPQIISCNPDGSNSITNDITKYSSTWTFTVEVKEPYLNDPNVQAIIESASVAKHCTDTACGETADNGYPYCEVPDEDQIVQEYDQIKLGHGESQEVSAAINSKLSKACGTYQAMLFFDVINCQAEPTTTPTITPTITPTETPITAPVACNNTCSANSDCQLGLICSSGRDKCRNPNCPGKDNCICNPQTEICPHNVPKRLCNNNTRSQDGFCQTGISCTEAVPTSTPTLTPTPTTTSTATAVPTGTPNGCGGTCGSNSNCQEGFFCYQGYCRNSDCPSETDCNCPGQTTTPTLTPTPTTKTISAVETSTPAPTEASLPQAGNITPTLIGLGGGFLLLLFSLLLAI